MSTSRHPPIVQLVEVVAAGTTPAFKRACVRGAAKRRMTLAAYVRLAMSEKMTADGVRHKAYTPPGEGARDHG